MCERNPIQVVILKGELTPQVSQEQPEQVPEQEQLEQEL